MQRLQAPRGVIAQALLGNVNPQLALNLRAAWEAINNRWNQSVLNYTQGKQLDLLKSLGFEAPSWEDLAYLLIGIVVSSSLVGAAWTGWQRSHQDPWLRLLSTASARLQQAGITLAPQSPPRQMAQQLQAQRGTGHQSVQPISDWLLRLEASRYAPQQTGESRRQQTKRLAKLAREFKLLPWPT